MMSRTVLAAIFVFTALGGGASAMASEEKQASVRQTFLILYRPGSNWDSSKRVWQQALGGHKDYLIGHYADGVLKFAGPFMDDWGGGVVVQTENAEAAADIARSDPAVLNGVFVFEVHPWFLVDWDEALTQKNAAADETSGEQ